MILYRTDADERCEPALGQLEELTVKRARKVPTVEVMCVKRPN